MATRASPTIDRRLAPQVNSRFDCMNRAWNTAAISSREELLTGGLCNFEAFAPFARQSIRSNRLPHQTRFFRIEFPTGNQELHRDRVIAGAEAHFLVELVRFFQLGVIDFDAESGPLRHIQPAT